jgi:hypothetical protein
MGFNGIYGGLMGFNGDLLVILWWFIGISPLVMTNIAMVKPWPIEIDDLPFLNMVIFHGYVK